MLTISISTYCINYAMSYNYARSLEGYFPLIVTFFVLFTGYSTAVNVWKINKPIDFKQCYCYEASFDVKAINMRVVSEGVVGGFRPILYRNPSATVV